jgi:hypothetical protein
VPALTVVKVGAFKQEGLVMSSLKKVISKIRTLFAIPPCPACGSDRDKFGYSYHCWTCFDKAATEYAEDEIQNEARLMREAVFASPEYQALKERVEALEKK